MTSSHAQALIAELVGTFALTFVAAGSSVVAHVSAGKMSEAAALIAPGLLVMTLIYTLGDVSGAHINPAVTLAFSLRGVFPWRSAFVYWLAQFVGAILAALLLRGLFGVVAQVGVTRPMGGLTQAFVMEIVATFLLVLVILGTADGSRLVGHNAGIAVGGVIALGGLLAGPISGASLNPARSLGPALAMGSLDNLWIYLLAPCLGATVAVGIIWLTRGAPPRNEAETATGDGTMGRS
ncbi:MAG TPA: aquaporin [Ktedonobacterales bacterium]|nr:aquaporin [Ktedonobacterales bacterium]